MTDLAEVSDADLLASLPRGIRNNNPLNLKTRGTKGQDGPFAVYNTPDEGIAAADRNLQAYHTKHGINTVAGVVNRWAPPNADGNHTANYTAHVAGKLGVDPNAPIDMVNPETRKALIGAMGEYENGAPITPERVASSASGGVTIDRYPTSPLAEVSDAELLASLPKAITRPPVPQRVASAPYKGAHSEALGFKSELARIAMRLSPYSPANLIPGYREANEAAIPRLKASLDRQAAVTEPGKMGGFGADVLASAAPGMNPVLSGMLGGLVTGDATDAKGVAGETALGGALGRAGALGSDAVQLVGRKLLSKVPKVPTVEALETAKTKLYDAAKAAGFTYRAPDVKALAENVRAKLLETSGSSTGEGLPISQILMRRLDNIVKDPGGATLEALDKLRSDAYKMAVADGGPESIVGGHLRGAIDDMMTSYNTPFIRAARAANTQWMKAVEVAKRTRSGELAAGSANSGQNVVNAQRAKIRPTIDPLHNSEITNWTPAEAKAAERVVMGGKLGNFYRNAGNFMRNPIISAGAAALGGVVGSPGGPGGSLLAGVGIPATMQIIGRNLRKGAEKETRKDIAALTRVIATGSTKPTRVPTKLSHAVETAIAKVARPAAVAAAVPALAASRREQKPAPKPAKKK